jgi:hypothetical protein
MKNKLLLYWSGLRKWDKTNRAIEKMSTGMLRHVALVKTDVSEERIAFIIRVTRIGVVRATLAVTTRATRRHIPRKPHSSQSPPLKT